MKPIKFKESNTIMKGPEGSDIGDLPVYRDETVCISKWKLDKEEMKNIIDNGGYLYLTIQAGGQQPPVSLSVLSKEEEGDE